MVLKRCIYGVDKNPMAVELAKVSLWLHTFTVGAPLSFLNHHLRCGDSLFGLWVKGGFAKASLIENGSAKRARNGATLFLHEPMNRALRAASSMQIIEGLTDAEIAEAHRSADVFAQVQDMTAPLAALLSFFHALDWLELNTRTNKLLLQAFLSGVYGDPIQIALGKLDPLAKEHTRDRPKAEAKALVDILAAVRELISEERFFHWQVAFPGVWSNWLGDSLTGGFDAVIGNPPWDKMKLFDVEWFAARRRAIALAQRASDRRRMIAAVEKKRDPLALDYAKAAARAEAGVRVARLDDEYPFLSSGDVNIYSLFVERALKLIKPEGLIGLLIPSGIASDKTAAPFFKGLSTGGRLRALYDFENKGEGRPLYFRDVHAQAKFCALIASREPVKRPAKCGFFLNDPSEIENPDRCFTLTATDFARLNPNTGTAPLFRTRRDAKLTTAIYSLFQVLVNRAGPSETKAWPVSYSTTYHMTNDSGLFRTRQELEEKEGAYPIGGNRFRSAKGDWVPLYEGKMIWHFDHRAASVLVNPQNQYRPAFPKPTSEEEHSSPAFSPTPQYWVLATDPKKLDRYALAFRDVTNPTDRRTFDACFVPHRYAGNTLPIVSSTEGEDLALALLCANFNSILLDYVARQKVQKNHLNWYIVEQLPIVPAAQYTATRFGNKTAAKIVREAVLELTYTAYDMASFARDMGYLDAKGKVKPPFRWDEDRRRMLRAKLEAVYFHIYGITKRDDIRYVYSTFDVIEREEIAAHGRYLSLDLCLAFMNALAAGDPDAEIDL